MTELMVRWLRDIPDCPGVLVNGVPRFAALVLLLLSAPGLAAENPSIGTWKQKSYVTTTTTGEPSAPFGAHPDGYLSYAADGRMHAIGTTDQRVAPNEIVATDEERIKLHRTMFAYAGKYSVEPGKVIHPVDISWNQIWNGSGQVRSYTLTGDTLTITTTPGTSAFDGRDSQSILVWKKVSSKL